jgi:endonuclease/exonuclease/phosphatase family metal-dependent hydrolase
MKIGTFNIRVMNLNDLGYKWWFNRKQCVANVIDSNSMDICAIQEVSGFIQQWSLINTINNTLGDKLYGYYGVGRDWLGTGEQTGILYRKDKFKVLDKGSFFLSETPYKRSKSWNAVYYKRTIWIKFKEYSTNKILYFFSTHLDCCSEDAKIGSLNCLKEQITKIVNDDKIPIFIGGDFNSSSQTNPIQYYLIHNLLPDICDANLDSSITINNTIGTYNHFADDVTDERIDYILTKNAVLKSCETITYKYNGHFPSDHLSLVAEVE